MLGCKPFKPAPWLKNPHLQTLWPYFFRRPGKAVYRRQRLELPDGDFIDLDWLSGDKNTHRRTMAILVHGLQGNSQSHYIRGMGQTLLHAGYRVIAPNCRGCSGELNRLPTSVHAGYTADIDYLIRFLKHKYPDRKIALICISLGASMMLNWLADEKQANGLIDCAVAVSTPFLLSLCADRLNTGFSKVYQHFLISSLKSSTAKKLKIMPLPNILSHWNQSKTFFEFDDRVTSRLHGFENVHDYYHRTSTQNRLSAIDTPLLLIQSRDDPFMPSEVIPGPSQLNPNTTLEVYDHGGHVGFVSANGIKPCYWLDQRILDFIEKYSTHGNT